MSEKNNTIVGDYGTSHKTLTSYLVGFILCVILTLIPFGLVAFRNLHTLTVPQLYFSLAAFAIIQLYVQVVCFLRLNASQKGRGNLMSFIFTIFIVAVIVGGSLWIMINLDYFMVH